jgi:Predicted membrane protein (DUF2207)
MRRWFGWLITLLFLAFGVLWPLVFTGGRSEASDAPDPVVITNFKADFVVDSDGRLDAVETITADFPGDRHGVFRYWDVTNQKQSPRPAEAADQVDSARRQTGVLPDALGGRPTVPGGQDR